MEDIREASKRLVLEQHPDFALTWVVDLTHLLGNAFPPGTRSAMVSSADTAWHVFWYADKHVMISEQEMVTLSVAEVRRQLEGAS